MNAIVSSTNEKPKCVTIDTLSIIAHNETEDKEELLVKNCLGLAKADTLAYKARDIRIRRQLYLTERRHPDKYVICTQTAAN